MYSTILPPALNLKTFVLSFKYFIQWNGNESKGRAVIVNRTAMKAVSCMIHKLKDDRALGTYLG